MSKIIGMDASLACSKEPRGIGVYEKNIGLPPKDFIKKNTIIVFGLGVKPKWICDNVKYINLHISNIVIREQIILPLLVFIYKIEQLHIFTNVAPILLKLITSCKIYLTIHDVSYKYSRKYMSQNQKQNTIKNNLMLLYRSILFNYSCRVSEKLFTVSNWSSTEIQKHCKHNLKDKLYLIPNICNKEFITKDIPNWLNRENRIILVTGAHPQKNLTFFLDCFMELRGKIKLDIEVDIVGVNNNELDKKYNSIERLKFHGKVSQSYLLSLYDNSKLLVMPSLFESYSIPLLEAKYRGLYILSSDGGATKEVASSYAYFFQSNNKFDFKIKFLKLLSIIDKPPTYVKTSQIDVNHLYWKHAT